ncbi:MAG: carbohydrate binding domain-containing protein, partial [Muribaculaceae bacterium]|nr:carbohydrate binding domain-containing protein [Muribaculaceae bacterium]
MNHRIIVSLISLAAWCIGASAQTVLEVNTQKKGAEIAPAMWGIFFEDINYGADGGLYGELVKNRSFEYPQSLMGWNTIGGVEVKNDGPFERCPHYVRLGFSGKRDMATGMENTGFLGMSLKGGAQYRFSVWARVAEGGEGGLSISLRDLNSQEENFTVCETEVSITGGEWKKYTAVMTAPRTIEKASLTMFLKGANAVD